MREQFKTIVVEALEDLKSLTTEFEKTERKYKAVETMETAINEAMDVDLSTDERTNIFRTFHDAWNALHFPQGEIAKEFLA